MEGGRWRGWKSGVWKLDELQGTRVSRATGDLTCGEVSVCVESHVERPHRRPCDPARHHCLFLLTSSRFCRPGILPMSCYHGYIVTGVRTHQSIRPCTFLFATAGGGAHIEKRVARGSVCETLCKGVARDDARGASDRAAIIFHCHALFVIHSCVCYFN